MPRKVLIFIAAAIVAATTAIGAVTAQAGGLLEDLGNGQVNLPGGGGVQLPGNDQGLGVDLPGELDGDGIQLPGPGGGGGGGGGGPQSPAPRG